VRAGGRDHLAAGLEAGCDIDAFGAQQRYESGAGDLVIVDDDDPGRPPAGAGGAGWHDPTIAGRRHRSHQ